MSVDSIQGDGGPPLDGDPRATVGVQKVYPLRISSGILDHYARMGEAVWLFMWLIDRTTREKPSDDGKKVGVVAAGHPIPDHEIGQRFGCSVRTVQRWRTMLKTEGYIKMENSGHGYCYTILNSKKWLKSDGPMRAAIRTLHAQAAAGNGR